MRITWIACGVAHRPFSVGCDFYWNEAVVTIPAFDTCTSTSGLLNYYEIIDNYYTISWNIVKRLCVPEVVCRTYVK